MLLSNIVIILSRAADSGNVGAVCRAMKNMGLSRLRVVAPAGLNEETIVTRAIHAADVWKNAEFFDTLADAAGDCQILAGTTRRRGKRRKSITIEPRGLVELLAERYNATQRDGKCLPIGLVFGNERTGLDEDELNLCNIASHVPVSEDFPSLNLSHAVQIYAYELFMASSGMENESPPKQPLPVKGEWIPLERHQADALTDSITNTLAEIGFYKYPGRGEQTRFLRDLISRAGLTEREGQYLADIFAKAARLGSMRG